MTLEIAITVLALLIGLASTVAAVWLGFAERRRRGTR